MKVRFIINPVAGGRDRTEEITECIRKVLKSSEGLFEIRLTQRKGDGYRLSREAEQRGYDFVFVCGGDGTVNEVGSALVGSKKTVLGIIPCGSGNGLARALHIPREIESAVRLLLSGRVKNIDVGSVDGRVFLSTAGFAIDAHISKRYNEGKRSSKKRGILPYFSIAFMEFMRYRPEAITIKIKDRYRRITPLLLTVANTEQYGADAIIAPGAVPDDGLLDVCIVPRLGFFHGLSGAVKLLRGRIDRLTGFQKIQTDSIEIIRKNKGPVHTDGETFDGDERLSVKVLPSALKILVEESL